MICKYVTKRHVMTKVKQPLTFNTHHFRLDRKPDSFSLKIQSAIRGLSMARAERAQLNLEWVRVRDWVLLASDSTSNHFSYSWRNGYLVVIQLQLVSSLREKS